MLENKRAIKNAIAEGKPLHELKGIRIVSPI
jgi:hypothetical protein